jgi:hypothetical protein
MKAEEEEAVLKRRRKKERICFSFHPHNNLI